MAARYGGPPPPRAWADRDPVAAARLTYARTHLKELADSLTVPVENLLTPDYVRRLMWEPPVEDDDGTLPDLVEARLTTLGARRWQVELTRDVLVSAIRDAKPGAATESAPSPAP
jgi:ribonuclease D